MYTISHILASSHLTKYLLLRLLSQILRSCRGWHIHCATHHSSNKTRWEIASHRSFDHHQDNRFREHKYRIVFFVFIVISFLEIDKNLYQNHWNEERVGDVAELLE